MTLKIISGLFKGRVLKTPKGSSTRPTQGMLREAVFNICQNEIHDSKFLDLFAGSGAMGFEALSRGASHVTFVDQNRNATSCIKENIATLQMQAHTTLIPLNAARALEMLSKKSAQFDIIYIDPPYDIPFKLESVSPLLAPNGIVLLEERHNPKKPHAPQQAPHLQFKETRRFGIALLSIFHYIS